MAEVELWVDGRIHAGWKEMTVTRAIDAGAGSFRLVLSDRWGGDVARAEAIPEGAACIVMLDGLRVITGWIDAVEPGGDASTHEILIDGRDRTGDLVDCSAAVTGPTEWYDLTVLDLAQVLAEPFGVTVTAPPELIGRPFAKFKIEVGESPFEAIERACRMRALLPASDAYGNLTLGRAPNGTAVGALVYGENILSWSAPRSAKDRFSQIIVKGQQPGADYLPTDQIAAVEGRAGDPGVGRYRPKVIIAEEASDTAAATERAGWEVSVRAARGRQFRCEVQGWRQAPGEPLWRPGLLTRVHHPQAGLDEAHMVVTRCVYNKGSRGSTTGLELSPPGAYDLRAEPETPPAESWL
ncbi:MAG: hypothetical protein RIB45_17900 [Marivibrio sp.]|uniref:phage baseplate assembly protein n=1 Tax=Marivibrio sp. TaxID=2039719 RepID=UPI0032EBC4B8